MQQSRIRTAAAFLVPLAAVSFGGCNDNAAPSGGAAPYVPDTPAVVSKIVEKENRALRNEAHKELVEAMKKVDGSLVDLLNNASYQPTHSAWYTSDRARITNTLEAINNASEQVLSAIDASTDKTEILVGFSRTLGEARGALDFTRNNNYDWIPDGGYHTLHGLLGQNRAVMRALHAPKTPELFSK